MLASETPLRWGTEKQMREGLAQSQQGLCLSVTRWLKNGGASGPAPSGFGNSSNFSETSLAKAAF
jgi:hypothetical protein